MLYCESEEIARAGSVVIRFDGWYGGKIVSKFIDEDRLEKVGNSVSVVIIVCEPGE